MTRDARSSYETLALVKSATPLVSSGPTNDCWVAKYEILPYGVSTPFTAADPDEDAAADPGEGAVEGEAP